MENNKCQYYSTSVHGIKSAQQLKWWESLFASSMTVQRLMIYCNSTKALKEATTVPKFDNDADLLKYISG